MVISKTKTSTMKLYLLLLFLFVNGIFSAQLSDSLRLNDIRVLTSHNSYKKKPDPKVLHFLSRFKKKLSDDLDPKQLDYGHLMLTEQLDSFQIRGFELDVNYDPKGGHFKKRRVNLFVKGLSQRISDSLYEKPGFKLLHIADVDYETNYVTFQQALNEIQSWSLQNPMHTPIFINIEIKKENPGNYSKMLNFLGFKKAIPFDEKAYSLLDEEILQVFQMQQLITPKELKGHYNSIKEKLTSEGWPLLDYCLGKIIFILDCETDDFYINAIDRNEDRPMFVYGKPDAKSTAFVVINDPVNREKEIQMLSDFYIVRTRTDAGTIEARNNDYSRFNAAIVSNAQIITTDYYKADSQLSDFYISLNKFQTIIYESFFLRNNLILN